MVFPFSLACFMGYTLFQNIITVIKRHKLLLAECLVLVVVGLLSVTWLRGELVVWKDWMFPLSPQAAARGFERSIHIWDSGMAGLGWQASRFLQFIPYQGFLMVSATFLPLPVINGLVFYGLFTLSGLSMYFLFKTIVDDEKWVIARVGGSLFYMLNMYSLIFVWGGFMTGLNFAYSIFPLIIGLSIRAIKSGQHVKYAFLISIVWVLVGNSTGNPEIALIILFMAFSYVLFDALLTRCWKKVLYVLRFVFIMSAIFIAVSAFWIIPMGYFSSEISSSIDRNVIGETDLQNFRMNSVPMLGALRLTGSWDLTSSYKGDPTYQWAPIFSEPLIQILTFIVPILAFLPVFLIKKYTVQLRNNIIFFTLFSLIGLILIVGSNPPFGGLLEWLFQRSSFLLRLFRFPYPRFGIIVSLCYSFLIGIGLQASNHFFTRISRSLRSQYSRIVGKIPVFVLFVIIFGIIVYPFWNGDVIYSGGNVTPSARVQLPSYYVEAASWFEEDKDDFNILSLPLGVLRYSVLNWTNGTSGYFAENPDMWLFNKPAIIYSGQGAGLAELFARSLISNYDFKLGSFYGWTCTSFSDHFPSLSVEKHDSKYVASIVLSSGDCVALDRQSLYDVQDSPPCFTVNLQSVSGNSGANIALLFYNGTAYQGDLVSDTISLGTSESKITDLNKTDETTINKWWFTSFEDTFAFNAWYFHTWTLSQPVSVEVNFQGSGFIDIVSDMGALIPKTFVENESITMILSSDEFSWFVPRVYKENNNLNQITVSLQSSMAKANTFAVDYADNGYVTARLQSSSIDGFSSFRPRIVLFNSDDVNSTVFITGSFLADYDVATDELASLLSELNVKYVLLHEDANWEFIKDHPWWITPESFEVFQNALANQKSLSLVRQLGELHIYQNSEWKPRHIYSATNYVALNTTTDKLLMEANLTGIISDNKILFLSNQLDQEKLGLLNSLNNQDVNTAEIELKQFSPTKYVVDMQSNGSFLLVLSETYHQDWIAHVNGQQLSNKYHFIANGYANAWYINQTGSITVTLEFWPQNLFNAGAVISIVVSISIVLYLVKEKIKILSKKY